jgi:two-component system, cell cycle sensor histidine kinase and response regulator CckA
MSRLSALSVWREGLLWKAYSVAALALAVAYFALGGNVDAQSAIYGLLGAAAPIAILVGVWHYRPERRLHWFLFAGGLALWCVGDTYWNFYIWVLGKQAPYPSFADVAYLASYPLLIAGILVLARGGGRPRVGELLDAGIVALAAGVVSTLFLLEPLLSTSDGTFLKLIAGGIPVLDVVLLIAVTQLLFRGRMTNFALRAFVVGAAALLVADAVYAYLALQGTYTTGMIIDAGWLACYGLWGIAALHPSMVRIGTLPERERVNLSGWRIGALLAALLVAPIVLFARSLPTAADEIAAVIVATMLLVGARVWILQRDSKKAQDALAQADERLGLAQRVAGVSTWDIDLATGQIVVSDELAKMIMGSVKAELTFEDWVSFVHPDDRDRFSTTFARARERGGDFELEYRFRSPDGTEGWLISRGRVFLEETGAPRAYGVVVDITLRRWMEEQLQRSEEGMRLAQELGGIGTWDTDLQTGERTWSQNLRRISGVSDDAVASHELFMELVHPDDRVALETAMAAAEDSGEHGEFEYRVVRPSDGEVRWMLSRGDSVNRSDGQATRFVGVAVDVTKRHTIEEKMRHNEEGFRLAEAAANVGTWDMNLVTGELAWSDSLRELMGVTPGFQPTYEAFLEWVHPDDRARVDQAITASLEGGTEFDVQYRARSLGDGEERWMESRGRRLVDDKGTPVRSVGVVLDITERQLAQEHQLKLEQQLRESQKLEAVGRLAGGIAHDFNNILLAIRGNGELALDALKHGESVVEEVEEIVSAADRASGLTGQLLAFSRRQVLHAEVLDLNDVIADMDTLLRRMIGEGIELQILAPDGPIHVSADRSQVEQVIANLTVNARDAMSKGGRLTLEVTKTEIGPDSPLNVPAGRYAMFSVSDTGDGMDAETVEKIFEPFFTTKEEGTGFGLSTVHGIVVQSGGSIRVYSEVGLGSTFKVFLPLAVQTHGLQSGPLDKVAAVTESAGETILLVEDDPHVQRIVRNILRRSGYCVLAAGGAEEALQLVHEDADTIDLLLSDLVMPGTSGRELAEQIQALRPDIAILYMSGYTDDAVIRRGVLEAGMAFIQKPFGAELLMRRVREVLDDNHDQPAAAA